MNIDEKLAKRMEDCIKQTHMAVTHTYLAGQIFELGGGAACFSGFDSYLSQVVGWGFNANKKQFKTEITAIEHFYKSLNHARVDIEFCPFAGNELAMFLSERGYQISELNQVSVLDLDAYHSNCVDRLDFMIDVVNSANTPVWAKVVAEGFGFPDAEDQFTHYAKAEGVTVFSAYTKDKQVAGGALSIQDQVCDLGLTSTLPAFRSQGLQKMLLDSRLNFAKKQGIALATVTTTPGSISDLNVQKMGFRCAYTRIKMTLFL